MIGYITNCFGERGNPHTSFFNNILVFHITTNEQDEGKTISLLTCSMHTYLTPKTLKIFQKR
jgi:hypothetical protein